jgi:hypothetical protein
MFVIKPPLPGMTKFFVPSDSNLGVRTKRNRLNKIRQDQQSCGYLFLPFLWRRKLSHPCLNNCYSIPVPTEQ